jgi:hypothetical protein
VLHTGWPSTGQICCAPGTACLEGALPEKPPQRVGVFTTCVLRKGRDDIMSGICFKIPKLKNFSKTLIIIINGSR